MFWMCSILLRKIDYDTVYIKMLFDRLDQQLEELVFKFI